ncbi:MAG: YkvA family protein [Saprospiraceae bacterium]
MEVPLLPSPQPFKERQLWNKLKRFAQSAGVKTVYSVLLLFYAFQRKDTPSWAKNIILGSLAYFLSPLDFVPDLTPIFGFTDDFGVLSFGLVTIAGYIDADVRQKARERLSSWFNHISDSDLTEVDSRL